MNRRKQILWIMVFFIMIWLKNADCGGAMTWNAALTYCNNLASGSCGLTDGSVAGDWRLPNVILSWKAW